MNLPDPFEMMEDRCEEWARKNVKGDIATCDCGKEFKLDEGMTLTSDPYAIPMCTECFNKYMFKE